MIPKIDVRPIKSRQGVVLTDPAKAQVHFIKTFAEDEFFGLVVNVDGDFCDVLPGCFDAMQAGPDDIFLPGEVLGEPVMLSIGSICTIPRSAIGEGFATLNNEPYNKIVEAMVKYDDGVSDVGFDRGYKYLSENDPRIETHHRMFDELIAAQHYEQNGERRRDPVWWPVEMPVAYDVAAASAEEQIRTVGYDLQHKGKSFKLMVQSRGKERIVRVWVSDENAEEVKDFPRCYLETDTGIMCEINDGCGEFSISEDCRFRLRMDDNSEVSLNTIE